MSLVDAAKRVAKEPPFRLLLRAALKAVATSVRTKAFWELGRRPHIWSVCWRRRIRRVVSASRA